MAQTARLEPAFSHGLLEVLPAGICYLDEDGVICHANERLQVLTGYAHDELVGQPIEMLVPSRHRLDVALVAQRGEAVMTRESGLNLLRRDGSELAIDVALAPLVLDGKTWTVVAVRDGGAQRAEEDARTAVELHTIAVELAAAEAIASSEQRFRLAFENNMAGIIFVDLDDRVLAANDSFCEMIGCRPDEVIGTGVTSFTHPEDRAITEETHRRLISGEAAQVSYLKRYVHKDGRVVHVEVSKSPARNGP